MHLNILSLVHETKRTLLGVSVKITIDGYSCLSLLNCAPLLKHRWFDHLCFSHQVYRCELPLIQNTQNWAFFCFSQLHAGTMWIQSYKNLYQIHRKTRFMSLNVPCNFVRNENKEVTLVSLLPFTPKEQSVPQRGSQCLLARVVPLSRNCPVWRGSDFFNG